MDSKRTKIIITILFLAEIILIFYVATYTFRLKSQGWIYESDDKITCMSITPTGSLLGVGGMNGSVTLISRGASQPYWNYNGNNTILSIKLSYGGDYLVAIDNNDTISLFSQHPNKREGKIYPIWNYHLPNSKIRDLYSSRGVPPIVYVLATNGGTINLISRWGEEIWQYKTGTEDVVATFSIDGTKLGAADTQGNIYLFRVNSINPIWTFKTELKTSSIAISYNNEFIVAGGETDEGKGKVYLFSSSGELIYNQQVEHPIRNIYISNNGENVIIDKNDGTIGIISFKEGIITEKSIPFKKRIQSISSSVFGSYVVVSDSEGDIYLQYLYRPVPLWKFRLKEEPIVQTITQRGESVYVSDSHRIYLLSNAKLEEIIPGSRIGWAIIFYLGIGITSIPFVFSNGRLSLIKIERGVYLSTITGFLGGLIIGILWLQKIDEVILLCGLGSCIGSILSWRSKGIISFFSGAYVGFFGSGITGFLLGLLIWFAGDERTIIQLMLENVFNGLKIGVLFGPIGAIIGTSLKIIYRK